MTREMEPQAHLEVLSDLTNETLEGELPDQELGGLLVAPNFTEGDRSGPETVRLLDTAGGGLDRRENKNKQQHEGAVRGRNRMETRSPVNRQLCSSSERGLGERTAAAVFLACFVASCLRGALPR